MKISDSYKIAINKGFHNVVFYKRDAESIAMILKTKIRQSNTLIIPPIQGLKVEQIDETHDKVEFTFDDYVFDGVITWRLWNPNNRVCFVFNGIE